MEFPSCGSRALFLAIVSFLYFAGESSQMPIRRTGGRKLKRSFVASSSLASHPHPASPQFHHDPSIIQLHQDPVLNALAHHKISENLAVDNAWEHVPKLPDHEVIVGVPMSGSAPPSMHMAASNGVAMGVQDVMIDTVGGSITQTFFGKRNPDIDDDDDWCDDYDIDDDDNGKKNREEDDDDDDDGRKPEMDDFKERFRLRMAPLIIAPRRVPARSAALLHKPVSASHHTPLSRLSYNSSQELSHKAHSYTGHSRLVVPQHISKLRSPSTGSIGYRLVSSLSAPRQSTNSQQRTVIYRPLRVLYD